MNGCTFSPAAELMRMMDPPPARTRCGGGHHHRVPDAGDVGVEGVLKDLRRHGIPGSRDADAGVRDHHVQPADLLDRSVDQLLYRREIAYVGDHRDDRAAEGFDLADRLVEVL